MNMQLILNETIANGLDIIGDRWTLLILQQAFYGRRRFEEFRKTTGASKATLTRRLQSLVEQDILYKASYGDSASRFEYKFTPNGLKLSDASLLAQQWEIDWQIGSASIDSRALRHTQCKKPLSPIAICRECKKPLIFDQVSWQNIETQLTPQMREIVACNSKRRKRDVPISDEAEPANLASLIGDRWSLLILIASFFGTHRYDDYLKRLNIPPVILSERLKFLRTNRLFSKSEYQNNPPRFDYQLTKKSEALFPFIMILRQWVIENHPNEGQADSLLHDCCGKPLRIDVMCGSCEQKPWLADIEFNLE